MIHDDFNEYEHAHQTDDHTGWYYRDEPYDGFLVADVTAVGMNGLDVDMAVAFEFTNLEDACGEPGYLVEAKLVPFPEFLSEEKRASVDCYVGRRDLEVYDVASYGLSVNIDEVWGAETWEAGYEELVSLSVFADMAPGFIMDRAVNRLGNTGWDVLADAIADEDMIDKALTRHHGEE